VLRTRPASEDATTLVALTTREDDVDGLAPSAPIKPLAELVFTAFESVADAMTAVPLFRRDATAAEAAANWLGSTEGIEVIAADCCPFGIAGTMPICPEAVGCMAWLETPEAKDDDEIEATSAGPVPERVEAERMKDDETTVDVVGAKSVNGFV
jgi:hypothetical protein